MIGCKNHYLIDRTRVALRVRTPLSPEESLNKVMKVSFWNGWSIVIIAGGATLISLVFWDKIGLLVGLLVTSGGAMELYGRHLVGGGDKGGMRWMMHAQLLLIGVICFYCVTRLMNFDSSEVVKLLPPDMKSSLMQLGISMDSLVLMMKKMTRIVYGGVIVLTLIYQGGMYFFYRRKMLAIGGNTP
jgi:ABC-type uncharacterized transport system permease subunit